MGVMRASMWCGPRDHKLAERVVHRRHGAHELHQLALLRDAGRLVAREDLDRPLARGADPAEGAPGVARELFGRVPRPRRRLSE